MNATLKLHLLLAVLASSPLISAFIASGIASQHHVSQAATRSLFETKLGASGSTTGSDTVTETYAKNVMNTYGRYPLTISHGKGCKLYDTSGKEYLDFASGIATCILGHANPDLKKAVSDQMDRIHHCSNLYFIPEQAKLASWLVKNSCADKAFFCNSGAEANEAAIKLARKYAHTKLGIDHPVIITALNSFHGRTLTAITATGQPKYQKDFGPLTPGFEYCGYNDVEGLRALAASIKSRGNGHGLAAILMEPLQGEGGIRPATAEFMRAVRSVCDDSGALMMVDEVQTGMGRTGKLWGYQNFPADSEPDVITSAKALGGGVPIGSMLCKDFCNVFGPGDHASTYGGNPLACAAGAAVATAIERDGILANTVARGEQLRTAIAGLRLKYPTVVSDIRGWGLITGMEISEQCPLAASDVTKVLMEDGVLVVPAGPKVVRFVPPLVVSEAEVEEGVRRLDNALAKLLAKA